MIHKMPWVFSEISKSEPQHLLEHGYLFGKGAYTKTILLKHCNFISTRCILIQLNKYIIYRKLILYYIKTESILVSVINETCEARGCLQLLNRIYSWCWVLSFVKDKNVRQK